MITVTSTVSHREQYYTFQIERDTLDALDVHTVFLNLPPR